MSGNKMPNCSTPPGKIITHYQITPLKIYKGRFKKVKGKSRTYSKKQLQTEPWWNDFDCDLATIHPKGRNIRGERVFGFVTYFPVEYWIKFKIVGNSKVFDYFPKEEVKRELTNS